MTLTHKADFKPGDIISWCDQEFIVIENNGYSGVVRENVKNNPDTIRFFDWDYGERCKLVKRGDTDAVQGN